MATDHSWIGVWKNQFESIVEITNEADGRITGIFRTALEDSALYGRDVAVAGTHDGNAIAFSSAGSGTAVSYTGMLVDGRMETLWTLRQFTRRVVALDHCQP
jgi:hypothetical protein